MKKRLCLTHHVTTKFVVTRKDLTILNISHPDWDFYQTPNVVTQSTLMDVCSHYRFYKYDCYNDILIILAPKQ